MLVKRIVTREFKKKLFVFLSIYILAESGIMRTQKKRKSGMLLAVHMLDILLLVVKSPFKLN